MLFTVETAGTAPSGEIIDTTRHRALASSTRVAILQLVRRSPAGLTAAEVARSTGRHLSTVREHLDQLTQAGLLVRERRGGGSPGRPAWCYRAGTTPETDAGPYRELAVALVEHLALTEADPWAAGVAAGRIWGRKLAANVGPEVGRRPGDRVLAVLDRLGFTPQVVKRHGPDPAQIQLHSCPFLDLVNDGSDVVCGVHLGVIRGAVGAAGGSGAAATLQPFGAPAGCVVRLAASAGLDPDGEATP